MKVKNVICGSLCVLICLSMLVPAAAAEKKGYLAVFGDSIATGYGLSDYDAAATPKSEKSWAVLLSGELDYTLDNLAVDGMTSAQLYENLSKPEHIKAVNSSDLVCISIGGNDLLALADKLQIPEIDPNDKEAITKAYAAVAAMFEQIEKDVVPVVETFSENLDKIFKKIRETKQKANIIIQTIYNPYANFNVSLTYRGKVYDFRELADKCVSLLNDEIDKTAKKYNVYVADVYSEFKKETTGAYLNAYAMSVFSLMSDSYNIDPHPTAAGHKVIAETYMKTITDNKIVEVETETETETETDKQTDTTKPVTEPPSSDTTVPVAPETEKQTEPTTTEAPETTAEITEAITTPAAAETTEAGDETRYIQTTDNSDTTSYNTDNTEDSKNAETPFIIATCIVAVVAVGAVGAVYFKTKNRK